MNGVHDMGGAHGFGPVVAEADEPWFHADWERRVFGLVLAAGALGEWNLDQSRSARESMGQARYLRSSYYEIWLAGLEALLAERGMMSAAELAAGRALEPAAPVARPVLEAERARAMLARGGPTLRPAVGEPRFAVGDAVRTRVMHPPTHTRLPRYVRGRRGTVELVHGCHVFPDSNAVGAGEDPQWLYTVRFSSVELWGEDADPSVSVSVDAWEPYLEAAS